jgi:hypothetical protein
MSKWLPLGNKPDQFGYWLEQFTNQVYMDGHLAGSLRYIKNEADINRASKFNRWYGPIPHPYDSLPDLPSEKGTKT